MHILLSILQKSGRSLNIRQAKACKFGFTDVLVQYRLILDCMIAVLPEGGMPVLPIMQGGVVHLPIEQGVWGG